jgi:hypothetical protein
LLATEAPYTGPSSATSFCGGEPPATSETQPVVVADHLARCDFLYQQLIQPLPFSDAQWIPQWTQPQLPIAVKIELAPLERAPELIPSLDIVVGLHPDRDFRGFFADR